MKLLTQMWLSLKAGSFVTLMAIIVLPSAAAANDTTTIGLARLFNNDYFGDGRDRWKTGSYLMSWLRGPVGYDRSQPTAFGDVIDYRLVFSIISPHKGPADLDRRYAGVITLGAHSHFDLGGAEVTLGGDIMAIGPQTRMSDFQIAVHEHFGLNPVRGADDQLEDDFRLSGTAEVAYPLRLSGMATLRPFIEAHFGMETTYRIGGDMIIGGIAQNEVLIRDPLSGHLIRGTKKSGFGYAGVLGADYTYIASSDYFPAGGPAFLDNRTRVRAGLHAQYGTAFAAFVGFTQLSREFEGQSEGQLVGATTISFFF
jgi:hypothetical protein